MSSLSSFSDFQPRTRNRRPNMAMIALNQQSRHAISRMFKHKTFKDEILAFYARQSEGLAPIPIYLHNTVYAQLVEQQHLIYTQICGHTSSSTKTSSIDLIHDDPIEKIFFEDISFAIPEPTIKKIPSSQEYEALQALLTSDSFRLSLAMQDLRLPTAWDMRAKGDHIDISQNCMQLTYRGNGKDDPEVSSARANYAMRRQCGVYYFEIHILSKGTDGHIGIGFCRRINSLDRFPGWEEHSWGYHAENGNVFSGPGTGKAYGPKYSTGDIIGCGIDFRDMSAFYTKNGIYLGTAFQKIKEVDLYPFVGFKTSGERIEANFGARPFKFDIQQYMANEKRALLSRIGLKPFIVDHKQSPVVHHSVATELADKVVVEYLKHHGYTRSAQALEKALVLKGNAPSQDYLDTETMRRQDIRYAILQGDIDRAVELCNQYYPDVLDKNPMVFFRLKCRKFMEMVKTSQAQISQLMDNDEYEAQSLQISQNTSSKREADRELENKKKKKQKITHSDALTAVMAYGNQLKKQYAEQAKTDESIRNELMTTFSTLAYTDLSDSAVAYLYESSHIEQVVSELNSAILVSLGKYPSSSLERIYRQTSTAIEELVMTGNAKAALLQPERDCFTLEL